MNDGTVRSLPPWRAKEFIADGRAKLAVVHIEYPESWPILASVSYPDDEVVVIKRPADLTTEKPIVNPYLPEHLALQYRKLKPGEIRQLLTDTE